VKKPIIILAIVTLMAGVILTGYMSSAQKHKAARASVLYTIQDSNDDLKDPNAAGQESVNVSEWITFKSESELKIADNEIRVNELKVKINNNKELFDASYRKKVAYLEHQIKYMKSRLENYGKSPGNWESFKYGFDNEMDAIENDLKKLTVDNKN
jgi:hypothetical protein